MCENLYGEELREIANTVRNNIVSEFMAYIKEFIHKDLILYASMGRDQLRLILLLDQIEFDSSGNDL